MNNEVILGNVTGPAIGLIFKEMVRRAQVAIQNQRIAFHAEGKMGYSGNMDDVKSSADEAAQRIYVKLVTECFPGMGIIAEEDDLRIDCTLPGGHIYVTIDPLDGTKAFVRKQSHGVGTMIALVNGREVVGSFIGDVNTGEIYYYRPGSDTVHRLIDDVQRETLVPPTYNSLTEVYGMLRDPAVNLPTAIRALIDEPRFGGLTKNHTLSDGSIGISMARLWKQEVGLVVLEPGKCTPWDWTPIYGICKKLGYKFLRPVWETGVILHKLQLFDPKPLKEITEYNHHIVVVHEKFIDEVMDHLSQ